MNETLPVLQNRRWRRIGRILLVVGIAGVFAVTLDHEMVGMLRVLPHPNRPNPEYVTFHALCLRIGAGFAASALIGLLLSLPSVHRSRQ